MNFAAGVGGRPRSRLQAAADRGILLHQAGRRQRRAGGRARPVLVGRPQRQLHRPSWELRRSHREARQLHPEVDRVLRGAPATPSQLPCRHRLRRVRRQRPHLTPPIQRMFLGTVLTPVFCAEFRFCWVAPASGCNGRTSRPHPPTQTRGQGRFRSRNRRICLAGSTRADLTPDTAGETT